VYQLRDAERHDSPDHTRESCLQPGAHSYETSALRLLALTLPVIHEQRMNAGLSFHTR
jgi:hypothetical protein